MANHRYLVHLLNAMMLLFTLACTSVAQDVSVLTGAVHNRNASRSIGGTGVGGVPLTFCAVILTQRQNCATVVATMTDSEGRFAIVLPELLPRQLYSLQLQFERFGIKEVPLGLGSDKQTWLKEQNIEFNELDSAKAGSYSYPLDPATGLTVRGDPISELATGSKRVFFATDRAVAANAGKTLLANTRDLNSKVIYGKCDVTIDLQKSLSDQFLDVFRDRDATREFLVRHISLETLPVFLSDLKAATKAASNRDALLFIHGYNVSFDDACRRAAQLAYDIKFQGQIILYSWPSHASVLNYAGDEEMTEWSQPHFNVFLKQLLSGSEISRLHVIAHSMGNRLLTGALFSNVLTEKEISHLGELVLAAPDVNRLIFDQYPGFKKRMTLYASDRDQALRLSKWFHGYSRAGDARPDIDIKAGMDSIDASAVDTSFLGHSYIGDSRSVLADVAALIPAGTEPIKRFGTVMAGPPSRSWWVIKP